MSKRNRAGIKHIGRKKFSVNLAEPPKAIFAAGIASLIVFLLSAGLALASMKTAAITLSVLGLILGTGALIMLNKTLRKAGRSSNELKGLNINQGELISGFSHRIREPLNNLVIIGELLSATDLSDKQKDMVGTLIASTTNMVSTVNELTMQTAGSIDPEKRKAIRFNLLSSIQNTIELFNLSGNEEIDFTVRSEITEGLEVNGDPIVIKQIVLDVLNTLSENSSDSRPSLSIWIDKPLLSGDNLTVNLTFSSNRHFITDDPAADNRSLALKLIEADGGEYDYSISEEKSRLSLTMPFMIPETGTTHPSIASRKLAELGKETPEKKELKDLNLLLVEDNAINQRITFLTLKPLVRSIDTASNGKEALDKIATADYDIILMDIQMPVMNGLVAAEKIRALEKSTGKHIPILAITANAMLGDKEQCLSAGMDDYISKPFNPAMLLEKISQFF